MFARGLEGNIAMMPQSRKIFIPLIAYFYSDGPPYDLTAYIWNMHGDATYISLEVTNVIVSYGNGETIEKPCASQIELVPTSDSVDISAKGSGIVIEKLVTRQTVTTVRLNGFVRAQDGKRLEFSVATKFVPEFDRSIKTTWEAMANM
jgi:hypothetical protein